MKYLFIAFFWAADCVLHSFLISIGFTKLMTRLFKKYYAFYRLFYVVLSIVLLIPLLQFTAHADNKIIVTYPLPLNTLRQLLLSGSLIMFVWAFFFDYDSLSFFGIRQILNLGKNHDSTWEIKKSSLLGIVRPPFYQEEVPMLIPFAKIR
jgi:methanethiol S-methyltransferase